MNYIHRDIENKLLGLLQTFPCLVLTGPRQTGKSTLLTQLLPDYRYVTLDDPLLREQALNDPRFFLDSLGKRAIIDEIQHAPGLLSYVKMVVDKNRDQHGIFVFTGSQQFSMMKNLGETLAGRIALLELLPFGVDEKRRELALPDTLSAFIHAVLSGSYPEPALNPAVDIHAWYASYLQTYLERDIRVIYNIGNLRDFQRFLQLLAARCAQQLNLSEYSRDLGVSVPTIRNWLSVLEASRIIYLLPPYYANLGKRIVKAPKLYFLDIGIVAHLTGIRDQNLLLKGPLAGPLFENFCIQETVKRFLHHGQRPPLFYLRTTSGMEVDLLVEKSFGKVVPIEIKLNKTPSVSLAQSLVKFAGSFPQIIAGESILLALTNHPIPLTREVTAVSLEDFLKRVLEDTSSSSAD
ncbi:ATP-binding protein [Desulfatirhabdium butyrativorans]|uniref:ATP-binding protein n=1 Tax=Desulfatirhabdium butyrativorans TaxID=340467 RepID=UPI00040297D4|nr:ATP-binding protein [Desulfatirhabdium butyrativorans]